MAAKWNNIWGKEYMINFLKILENPLFGEFLNDRYTTLYTSKYLEYIHKGLDKYKFRQMIRISYF